MRREVNQTMRSVARLKDVPGESCSTDKKQKQNCNTIRYWGNYICDKHKHMKKLVENYSVI